MRCSSKFVIYIFFVGARTPTENPSCDPDSIRRLSKILDTPPVQRDDRHPMFSDARCRRRASVQDDQRAASDDVTSDLR